MHLTHSGNCDRFVARGRTGDKQVTKYNWAPINAKGGNNSHGTRSFKGHFARGMAFAVDHAKDADKKEPAEAGSCGLSPKQFCVRSSANKDHAVGIQPVDQKQITFRVAFTVIGPFALQFMIQPLWCQRPVIGNQPQHDLLEALHVLFA